MSIQKNTTQKHKKTQEFKGGLMPKSSCDHVVTRDNVVTDVTG